MDHLTVRTLLCQSALYLALPATRTVDKVPYAWYHTRDLTLRYLPTVSQEGKATACGI